MNTAPACDNALPVVFLWHMHQPEYRVDGVFHLPWVYLHGIGAYSDMASHLEAVSDARAVVNFSPVLLDQVLDYAARLGADREFSANLGDALLDALRLLPPNGIGRASIVHRCLPVHRNRRTDRHPAFLALVERVARLDPGAVPDSLLSDLLVWFHLNWLGESLRDDARAQALLAKGGRYDAADRRSMLALISDALTNLIPRYRALAERGQIELSMTPYHHPLLPLLLDFQSAADTAPGVSPPAHPYPEGESRARWHLQAGRARFVEIFGQVPQGCWPSEAALSDGTLGLLDDLGFAWTASSGSVLSHTASHHHLPQADPFSAWQQEGRALRCYFRDDGLSDRIGFAYKDWHADDAVADLLGHLEQIHAQGSRQLVLIALDGENAWEFYADNGIHFLRGLYRALARHPRLRMLTLQGCAGSTARSLPSLRAGSWVHGQLLTWVGHAEKNRAWALLMAARERFLAHAEAADAALVALGACEGSDWFWWPGATNPPASVNDFDTLFRAHLRSLYETLGESPPEVLNRPFAHGSIAYAAAGGTMRPTEPASAPWIERCAGVLLDLHALPVADLDDHALRFADLVRDAGLRVWQLLPVGPRDAHFNPFQPSSAFAGDTTLLGRTMTQDDAAFAAFCAREHDWLDDWALFVALKAHFAGQPWWEWPATVRDREPQALTALRVELADVIAEEQRQQFRFDTAWTRFRRSVNSRGVLLFGDVPLFVAHDSADAWARRELFELDAAGHCAAVVGVPPDAFADEGQWWGYAPYRWRTIAEQDFRWWKRRFEIQARRFDLIRIDHFRGLAAWWRIPSDARSAREGAWISGPGAAAVESIRPLLGTSKLVAEDLGVITDDVVALRRELAVPGMRVLQFAFDGDPANPHLPRHHEPDSVCYSGTHDNDTTLGWWSSLPAAAQQTVRTLLGSPLSNMPGDFIDIVWDSPAPLAIVPMQDLLALGSEARTNVPGVAENNWRWKFRWDQILPDFSARLHEHLHRAGRLCSADQPLSHQESGR